MIIYSVHIQIDAEIEQDWYTWMQDVHIPEVVRHRGFIGYQILKIENSDSCQYRIDYYIETFELYQEYQERHAPELQKKHAERYEGKFTAHRIVGRIL